MEERAGRIRGAATERDHRGGGVFDAEPVSREVMELWERAHGAMEDRSRFSGNWEGNIRLYLGNHWQHNQVRGSDRPQLNLTFAASEVRTALLVENMGKIHVLPRRPSASGSATMHQALLSYVMDVSRYQRARKRAIKNVSVMGTGIVEFQYNPIRGIVEARSVDTRQFFVQPGCLDLEDASYCGTVQHIPLSVALERWPELEGRVFPGRFDGMENIDPERLREGSGQGPFRFFTVSGISGVGIHSGSSRRAMRFADPEGEVVTYMRQYRREKVTREEAEESGGRLVAGRHAYFLHEVVNNIRVRRIPWPLKRVPYAVFRAYDDTWAFYAPASIDFLRGLQKSVDLRLAHLLDWLDAVIKPTLIYDEQGGAVMEYNEQSRTRTLRYRGAPGVQRPVFDRPADVPSALFTIIEMEWQAFDRLMGNIDILQGQRPVGVQTGEGLKVLTENANARIRSESRSLAEGDYQAAWIMLEMARYYMAGEIIRYGEEFGAEDMGAAAAGLPPGFAQIPGDYGLMPLDELDLQIDFTHLTPEDRKNRGALAMQLFSMGVYDAEDLLDALDDPGRKRILEKIGQRQQAAAAAARQQQQQQQAAPAASSPEGGGGAPSPAAAGFEPGPGFLNMVDGMVDMSPEDLEASGLV